MDPEVGLADNLRLVPSFHDRLVVVATVCKVSVTTCLLRPLLGCGVTTMGLALSVEVVVERFCEERVVAEDLGVSVVLIIEDRL